MVRTAEIELFKDFEFGRCRKAYEPAGPDYKIGMDETGPIRRR